MLRKLRISWMTAAVAVAVLGASLASAAPLGKVVPIGGNATDVALDEARGRLYIANFTANRIEVMSLATNTIQTSINIAAQPNSISLSPDGKWLAVTHYGNRATPASQANVLTLVNLSASNARQTFSLPNPPLGVAFGIDNRALVVTTREFLLFDPTLGTTTLLRSISEQLTQSVPQPPATFPAEFAQASVGVSGDGYHIWGFADDLLFHYETVSRTLVSGFYSADPPLGPRAISVGQDGRQAAMGWWMMEMHREFPRIYADFPEPLGDLTRGGHAIDSAKGVTYSQVPSTEDDPPVLTVYDLDNLTVRERWSLPEHLAGRAILSSNGETMYAVSASGVTVLPVGKANQLPRVIASVEDVIFRGDFCERGAFTQTFVLSDPGGARVPFAISANASGVRVTPSSGVTPAVISVTVDPNAFANAKGTTAVTLEITSGGINLPNPVRVLVNMHEPDQRGSFINVPGKLVDMLADPEKDQYYVLRQDKNQLLVFNGANNTLKATLRTCNTPMGMALTFDRQYLLVGCENSRTVSVFDRETLEPHTSINTPNRAIQSIASTSRGPIAVARRTEDGTYGIVRLDMAFREVSNIERLGVWENEVPEGTVAIASPNGASAMFASPDGTLTLYDANVNDFTISRQDFTQLSGAYAASAFGQYVVGNRILNSSLVQEGLVQSTGTTSGFVFVDQNGIAVSAAAASDPGVIARINATTGEAIRPTRTVEAPLLASAEEGEQQFTRTLGILYSRNYLLVLSVSGVTVLPQGYDASVAPPVISRVASAADGVSPIAPGGLFTIYGSNLSPTNIATTQIPLPTALGQSCLTVNGQPVPVIFVSPQQVNAQMPFQTIGNTTLIVHTPGGVSDNYNLTVLPGAPSVFAADVTGQGDVFPTIVRLNNNLMVTDSNPVHRNDTLVIYLTGLGQVTPFVENGRPAPSDPLANALTPPSVTLGGHDLPVLFAGLAPGQVGLYQINVSVPFGVPLGLSQALKISQGTSTHTVNVRVVN